MNKPINWIKPWLTWAKNIKIIPQRDYDDPKRGWGINTFHRWSHYDKNRGMQLNYDVNDAKGTHWKNGDFIGQCTGLAVNLRAECINELLKSINYKS